VRVAIQDHGAIAETLGYALKNAGHELSQDGDADLLLIDYDPPIRGYAEVIDYFHDRGSKIVLYPHGATANLVYDGLWEPDGRVAAQLTIGPGEIELMRRLGIDRPTFEIGWFLCPQLPFRPRQQVRRVTFAPTHPSGEGAMLPHQRDANRRVFERLLAGSWKLTVRHLGTLAHNGIWEVEGVKYVLGNPDLSTAEIDSADCVVAGMGTFPAIAVARGVPTVMYGQVEPKGYGIKGEPVIPLGHPELYRDLVTFPFDALGGSPLDKTIAWATESDTLIQEWKRNWVGEPFDAARFVALLERIVGV
jgi:hypothetical protein